MPIGSARSPNGLHPLPRRSCATIAARRDRAAALGADRTVVSCVTDCFEKEEPGFPAEWTQRKARWVRNAIAAIEAAVDAPELIRLPAR